MKKLLAALLITSFINTITSCQKEAIDSSLNAASQNRLSMNNSSLANDTKFGIFSVGISGDDKITVAKNLDVNYVRDNIILTQFRGKAPMLDKYNKNSLKVVLNLNYQAPKKSNGSRVPVEFPTNMTTYRSSVEDVLNKYTPELVVIENEPYNDDYYKGGMDDYITELKAAIDVCHQKGIKVADGGLNPQMVCILVYQDYVNRGMQKQANDFADRALKPENLRAAEGNGSSDKEQKINEIKTLIDSYKKIDLDYVNLHWYEPLKDDNDPGVSAPGVLKEVADYLRSATGKDVITNEYGQDNEKPSLVTSMVNELKAADFKYAVQFSGEGVSGAVPLTNGTTLKPNGKAFKDAID